MTTTTTSHGRRGRARALPWYVLVPGSLAVVFLALPVAGLLGQAPWGRMWTLLSAPASLEALRLSLATSLLATAVAVALGLPLAWLMAHHLGPRLKEGASVVLVGSNIGLRAIPDSAAYSVAKAGVHMLAKVLALEWAPRGIRCNAIAPGPIHTPMVDARLATSADPMGDLAKLSGVNPLKRLGTTQEVAALAAHLLSDESGWTTGAVVPIDGGASAVF